MSFPQGSSIFPQLARHSVPAGRGRCCSVVPLLSMELDGAGTAVDPESTQTPDTPNRPGCGRCRQLQGTGGFHFERRGGPIVSRQERLLDMLRRREAGTAHSAVQVHRWRQLGAPRVPAALAGGKLCQFRHRTEVQSVRVALRDRAIQSVSIFLIIHAKCRNPCQL